MECHDAYPELRRDLRFFPLGIDHPRQLSPSQISHYNQKGYLAPLDLFGPEEINAIRADVDRLLERAVAAGWASNELTNWHKHCRSLYDLATHPRLLDLVQDLLGETLILRNSHFFIKFPGEGARVSWHQDASYWPISPSKVVSVWLAIDDADEANGAMRVIPGSHLAAQIPFRQSTAAENNMLNQTVDQPERHGAPPVTLALKAGQVSLHSDWILHGSEPNRSSRRRCGLALRYLSSDVRAFNGWNRDSIICRGSDPSGHWADHPRPADDVIPDRPTGASLGVRALADGWLRDQKASDPGGQAVGPGGDQ